MKKIKNNFTLIEILAVCIILAVLMGISVASFQYANQKMVNSKTEALIKKIELALQSYRDEQGYFPMHVDSPANPISNDDIDEDNYPKLKINLESGHEDTDLMKYFNIEEMKSSDEIDMTNYYVLDGNGNPLHYCSPGLVNVTTFDVASTGSDTKWGDDGTDGSDIGKGDDLANFKR